MHQLTHITQEALMLVLLLSAPPVIVSMTVGFIIAVFQATTQIHESTISFAPKLVATFMMIGLAGTWTGAQLSRFAFHVFDRFPALIGQ